MRREKTELADIPLLEVRPKTLPEQVFEVLSDAILAGALKEGQRLPESELAGRMGISRAPVREALAELEKQGLAVHVPRKGKFVAEWSKEDLWEVATLRSVLEGLAAKFAHSNLEPADVHFLKDVIKRMETAEQEGDDEQLITLDLMFHSRIWECSRHKRLQRVLEGLKLQAKFFMIVTRPSDVVEYNELHLTLLEALLSQDADQAQQAAIKHVLDTALLALRGVPDDNVCSRLASFAAR